MPGSFSTLCWDEAVYPWVRLCVCVVPAESRSSNEMADATAVIYVFTPLPPHVRESKSTRFTFYWQQKKQSIMILFPTWQVLLKNTLRRVVIWLTRFPQLFKGEGTDDSEQVRRTQTCAHWLMIKPYINVRYDRLQRDGVQNPNDAAHQLSFASFASLTRLHSSLHLTGDLGRYCYSLVDRDVLATFRYLWNTNQRGGAEGRCYLLSL